MLTDQTATETPTMTMAHDPEVRARLRAALRLQCAEERLTAVRQAIAELVEFLLDPEQRQILDRSDVLRVGLNRMVATGVPTLAGNVQRITWALADADSDLEDVEALLSVLTRAMVGVA